MTLYIYYNGHTNTWVVTREDPGPGRILRCEYDSTVDGNLEFFDGDVPVEWRDAD